MIKAVEPILTGHLFAGLHERLMTVLSTLTDEQWLLPTAAGTWRVRDIVAHLLDGDVRQISFRRDRLPPGAPPFPIESYADLVRFIDGLNAGWVDAFERASPRLLMELHATTGPEAARVFEGLDPMGQGLFGVAWAGEFESTAWFDTAREYTERWHHQQQIRDAVGAAPLTEPKWLNPVIDTFLRALPNAYRDADAPEGTRITVRVTGEAGGEWSLRRESSGWTLLAAAEDGADTTISADADTVWRLMTKGLAPEVARPRVRVEGIEGLDAPFLRTLAIMG